MLATGARPVGSKGEDESEDTRVRLLPLEQARLAVASGEIGNVVAFAGLPPLEGWRMG